MSAQETQTEPRFVPVPGTILKARDLDTLSTLSDMRAETAALRVTAEAECEKLKAEAREEGMLEGLADAAIASARIVAATTARMQAMMESMNDVLANAATDAAQQIVGTPAEPETASKAVSAALTRAQRHLRLRLFVWPAAVDAVRDAAEDAVERRIDDTVLLSVESDPRLEPGRIVMASERGYVELGVTEQLDIAKDLLAGSFAAELAEREQQADAP